MKQNKDGYTVKWSEAKRPNRPKRAVSPDQTFPLHSKKPYEREQDKSWNKGNVKEA